MSWQFPIIHPPDAQYSTASNVGKKWLFWVDLPVYFDKSVWQENIPRGSRPESWVIKLPHYVKQWLECAWDLTPLPGSCVSVSLLRNISCRHLSGKLAKVASETWEKWALHTRRSSSGGCGNCKNCFVDIRVRDLRLIVPVPRVMAPSHNSGVRLRVSHWPFKPPLLVTGHRRRSSFPPTRPYVTMQSVICVCVSRIYRDSDRSHLVRLSREPRAPQFLSCSPGNFLKMAQVASGGPHLHQHILTRLRCWK